MSRRDTWKIKGIQVILGVDVDGIWGSESQAALDELTDTSEDDSDAEHDTYASSFADPADIEAFDKCKAQGKSDSECFKYGDNGIGCWGDSTKEGSGPSCALPPEYMEEKWGSKSAAKHKKVKVRLKATGGTVICVLKDQMPSVENLHNEAHIDLNPDACYALDLEPPIMVPVVWQWLE